jgi:hypothetical protein
MDAQFPHPRYTTGKNHGEIFLWPAVNQIPHDVQANLDLFAQTEIEILGRPLRHWRKTARRDVMKGSRIYHEKLNLPIPNYLSEAPLLVTGHQPGFFHGGILAKYLLLDSATRSAGGAALNLVADSDLPRHIALRIPTIHDDGFTLTKITLPSIEPHVTLEYQPLPEPAELQRFLKELQNLNVAESIDKSIKYLVRVLIDIYPRAQTLTDLLVLLNQYWAANLTMQWLDLPVSQMAQSSAFLIFAADMIQRAGKVRHCYNTSLRQYRRIHKIRNASQPLPELQGSDDPAEAQELPLWVFQPNQPRQPLWVQADRNAVIIKAGRTAFTQLSLDRFADPDSAINALHEALNQTRMQIRPRALTLTAFARLFLADYFVHGIGGARYDHVTDEFIRRFYQIDPPSFATATATVFPPIVRGPDQAEARENVQHARTQWRDLNYNPQRYISEAPDRFSDSESEHLKQLVSERAKAIRTGDRLRRERGAPSRRRQVFHTIHRLNADIRALLPGLKRKFFLQLAHAESQMTQVGITHDREYFFGLIPGEDLKNLQHNPALLFS